MKKERVVQVDEIMGFSPKGLEDAYISRLLIESEGVGSDRLMLVHATLKPGKNPGGGGSHPAPYDEAYYILRGQGRMEFGDGEVYDVGPNTAIFIPGDTWHMITNVGDEDLEFLTIWPITPAEEGINGVSDERKRAWGVNFRKKES
ncbi:MAG: cupin domain-containing protein [Chloroflexi bacterium]|jgi:mannose-6-phosphate isomerase-like protein (cupin superfamily)|nr:cupin domain-containing protein [Chloroflexota bacterium]